MDWLLYENSAKEKGFKNVCGVDEAGRGPLAGPVVVAGVIMPEDSMIEGVNDSKKVSEKKREKTKSESSDKQQSETKSDSDEPTLAENIPPEIRSAFIRATKHPLDIKINLPDSESATDTDTTSDTLLPLPSDFDITLDTEQDDTTVPTFTDFNFGNTTDTNTSDVIKYLNNTDTDYTIINDIIITDKHAIAVHDDADFWVCDNEQWFATGKSKPSPILAVKSAAEQNNVKPVLYLSETNIMDIDTLIPQWELDGISVITDINNL